MQKLPSKSSYFLPFSVVMEFAHLTWGGGEENSSIKIPSTAASSVAREDRLDLQS